MKGFKIKTPKYILDFEKKHGITQYIWEDVRDKFHNIISSTRKYGLAANGEKIPVPRNEEVEKAVLEAKKAIREHFKMNEKLKKMFVPKTAEDPRYYDLVEKRDKMQKEHDKTASKAREMIKAVETVESKKK